MKTHFTCISSCPRHSTLLAAAFAAAGLLHVGAAEAAPFFIEGLANKCIDASPPEIRHLGRPVYLGDCNDSSAQWIEIVEVVPERHEVVLKAGDYCIGPQGGIRNVGARLELQTCCPSAMEQRFAIDGDSIINLASPPSNSPVRGRLVIEPERGRTANGTALVFGERHLDDSEFWTFTPTVPPPVNAPSSIPALSALRAPWDDVTLPGRNYRLKPTTGFVTVWNEADLRQVFDPAAPVPLHAGMVVELAADIALIQGAMRVPEGVTIRGGRRGLQPGFEISSPSDFTIRDPLFIVEGDNVRITGLRIRGPSYSRDPSQPAVAGIRANTAFRSIIDHNELSQFTGSAIGVAGDQDGAICGSHPAARLAKVHVIRNYIHHNQRQNAGYGVVVADGGSALIQGNTFNRNRHAIAASYDAGNEYYAYDNLVMPESPLQEKAKGVITWHTHDFDVHGSGASIFTPYRGGTAGNYFDIARNTFLGNNRENLDLRGTPCLGARFYNNVTRRSRDDSVKDRSYGNVLVEWDNQFGASDPRGALATGDFDGDGTPDQFLATGSAWYYQPGGTLEWRFLRASPLRLDKISLGDEDQDGRTDAVYRAGYWIMASWGASSPGDKIGEDPQPPNGGSGGGSGGGGGGPRPGGGSGGGPIREN